MSRIFGFGAERIPLPPTARREDMIAQRTVMLARCLNMKTTVAFIGAGCSMALGYPDWQGLVAGAIAAMRAALKSRGEADDSVDAARLTSLAALAAAAPSLTSDDYLVILGVCQKISKRLARAAGHDDPYGEFLRDSFSGASGAEHRADPARNPYLALLKLPLYRFVTTNYDLEIERAICSSPDTDLEKYGLEGKGEKSEHLSFTQRDHYIRQLSGFVLEWRGTPRKVFHCHGRCDDLDSIVSTESDYQQWYLRDEPAGHAFRQNLELLFGSNPIFFIGFSMRDNDLLHALRILRAGDPSPQKPRARSLFALLPDTGDEAADGLRDDFLLERYQVNVVPYDPAAESTHGASLCRKLAELRGELLHIRGDFLAKPVIRKVVVPVQSPDPYLHYAVKRHEGDDLAPARTRADLDKLLEHLERKSMIVVHGYGGSGKSWRVLDLIDEIRLRHAAKVEGIFFWSSYYADDWLTGLDRALEYFGSSPAPRKTRMQRFSKDCLRSGRHLIVLDGFERLLRDRGSAADVRPANRAVAQLLEFSRDKDSRSTVILTTRLMPDMLKNDERVAEFSMRRATTKELAEGDVFGGFIAEGTLTEDDLAAVCSLCDGHSYALALAAAFLGRGGSSARERLGELRHRLSDVSPARRLPATIHLSVDDVRMHAGGRAIALLERIAMFMSPVVEPMMEVCAKGEPWKEDCEALLKAGLLFRVSANPESDDAPGGFTVHPTVRSAVLHESASEDPDQIPTFSLPGYTAGSTPVHPGSEKSIAHVREIFRATYDAAELALERGEQARARELCRGAFGLVRSRMESNSISRWTTYDDYIDNFVVRLAILAKRTAPETWDYMDRSHAPRKERKDAPLFADELAWLWNDIGLAFFSQGAMTDSHAVFELSYEIDRVTDSYEDGGQYLVQSRLHMAAAFIQMGRLHMAAEYLADTEESNRSFRDDEYAGRILGYKALLAHLRGNTDEADELYAEAMEKLQRNGPNLRGRSIFAQHHADLKIYIRDYDAAAKLVRTSRALAEEGKHVDLVAYARNSNGHLLRVREKYHDAYLEYEAALSQARDSGIRGLESDVLSELAHLALTLGDWDTARVRAVASLRIANELWLGLRSAHGLVVLGKAMVAGHDRKLGAAYLHHARTLATQQGYLLRAQEAEKELRDLGELIAESRKAES